MCIAFGQWIGHLLWNLLHVCWDRAEDFAFTLDGLFYRMVDVSWGFSVQFGSYVLYAGTWAGDRRLNFVVMLDM